MVYNGTFYSVMTVWMVAIHHELITAFQSGLTAACRASSTSLSDAEKQMLSFIQEHTPEGQCPLAGNTVHMDLRFLAKYMPRFTKHLHYRIVDVSTVKELCRYACFPQHLL